MIEKHLKCARNLGPTPSKKSGTRHARGEHLLYALQFRARLIRTSLKIFVRSFLYAKGSAATVYVASQASANGFIVGFDLAM
jgi:hypothetical protein